MAIKDKELWEKYVESNKEGYGMYIIDMARIIINKLDESDTPLHFSYDEDDINSPHGLICFADRECGSQGASGFQVDCVTQVIFRCHSRGEEFKLFS